MWKKIVCLMLLSVASAGGPCGTSDPLPTPPPPASEDPPIVKTPAPPLAPRPLPPLSPPLPRSDAISYLLYLMDESIGTEDATITVPANSFLPIRNDNPNGNSFKVGRDSDGTLYVTFLKFSLATLPRSIDWAQINFRLLNKTGTIDSLAVDRLKGPWTEAGTLFPAWIDLGIWRVGLGGVWDVMNITRQYQDWVNNVYPNNGLMLRPDPYTSGPYSLIFGSSESDSLAVIPLLEIWGVKPGVQKFRFPLTGRYSHDRVGGGYTFRQWWENQTCLNTSDHLLHTGTDFAAEWDDIVFSVEEGTVVYSTRNAEQGGYIAIEHHDDYGTLWTSVYEHVAPYHFITVGANLAKGTILGNIVPGTVSYGPHLHLHCHVGHFRLPWSLRGRLPDLPCTTEKSQIEPEPALNSMCFDPETMAWE